MQSLQLIILGSIAGFLIVISLLPQLYTIVSMKSAKDISITTYIILFIAQILWTIYGFINDDIQLALTNIISGTITFLIICVASYYKINENTTIEPFQ